jgi:sarcosine oxidase subunit beta
MKISVIGAGIVGCATAWELSRRGFEVVVLDRLGEAGHGSTSASCGIVRRLYAQPGMIAMAHESLQIWAGWDSYIGPIGEETIVFHRPGMLFIPPRLDDPIKRTVAEMQRLGIKASILSAEEVTGRFPFLDTASHFPPKPADDPAFLDPTGRRLDGAVFEEDAGYVVSPGLATHNLRLAAERDGVRFLLNREVTQVESVGSRRFRLRLMDGEAVESDAVVNAAGPHSSKVNRLAGVTLPLEIRPLRREVHALANPRHDPGGGLKVPVVGDLDGGIYFRPETGGRDLIVGSTDPECDTFDWVEDPDRFETGITDLYRQRQCMRLMKRFPEVRLGPRRGLAAMYDVSVKDWYPIVDKTDLPGYYVCIGTSGSSFKTAPVLGRLTAEIVEACEGGRDTDGDPIQLSLPRIETTIDTRFLSRLRGRLQSSGTVIG